MNARRTGRQASNGVARPLLRRDVRRLMRSTQTRCASTAVLWLDRCGALEEDEDKEGSAHLLPRRDFQRLVQRAKPAWDGDEGISLRGQAGGTQGSAHT